MADADADQNLKLNSPDQPDQAEIPPKPYYIGDISLGSGPMTLKCPHCNTVMKTVVQREYSAMQHVFCGVLFLVGCWICSCIPYCMDSLYALNHYCSNCKVFIGRYKP